jgi:hypothetical protein
MGVVHCGGGNSCARGCVWLWAFICFEYIVVGLTLVGKSVQSGAHAACWWRGGWKF